MAKIIWKGPIVPDDPIFKQGWVLSNPKLKGEPKQSKNKPKQQQEKKVRSSSRGGGESSLLFRRWENILQLGKYGLCEGHN